MEKKDVLAALKVLELQKVEIDRQIAAVYADYEKTAPFQKGDTVRVFDKFDAFIGLGIVNAVNTLCPALGFGFQYDISKLKKDGTKSLIKFASWDVKRLAKYEQPTTPEQTIERFIKDRIYVYRHSSMYRKSATIDFVLSPICQYENGTNYFLTCENPCMEGRELKGFDLVLIKIPKQNEES